MERNELPTKLESIAATHGSRFATLKEVAILIRQSGSHRWVGLYDVDHATGLVTNIVWSGPGAPEFPTFPMTKGLTGAAISGPKNSQRWRRHSRSALPRRFRNHKI